MMRFFDRAISLRIPEDPIEGAVKGLFLAQFITLPMTANMEINDSPESIGTSVTITMIHISASLIGGSIGLINYCLRDDDQANRQLRR